MDVKRLLDELYTRKQGEIKLDLERVTRLAALLGNPEKRLKAIHVAGSNGKGSTCIFLFSILRETGYKVGLYTSPHLRHFNERIRINNRYISDKDIVRLYSKIKPHLAGDETFFEITTMMAFLYFAQEGVDIAVIEVGLGGRLDATNLLTPLVSVITRIDLEHTNLLGTTIEQIAGEKAGIIKKNIPVITGATGRSLTVIKGVSIQKNAPLVKTMKWRKINNKLAIGGYKDLQLGIKGDYQPENAALALTILGVLQKQEHIRIPKKAVGSGLKKAYWPGRLEYIAKNVLIDSAHNAKGMELLGKELKKIKKAKVMVIGILNDKDIPSMMKIASQSARLLILTTPQSERAAKPEELARHSKSPCIIASDPKQALKEAKKLAKKDELIVITGSIYLLGEYLDPLRGKAL